MRRRSSCPGLDDHLARAPAVDGPSTGSAATRSASEYRLSPARRCEKEAGIQENNDREGGWGAERVRVRSTVAQTPRASCVCSRPIAHRFGEGFTSSSPTVQQCLFRVQKRTSAPCCWKVRYAPEAEVARRLGEQEIIFLRTQGSSRAKSPRRADATPAAGS